VPEAAGRTPSPGRGALLRPLWITCTLRGSTRPRRRSGRRWATLASLPRHRSRIRPSEPAALGQASGSTRLLDVQRKGMVADHGVVKTPSGAVTGTTLSDRAAASICESPHSAVKTQRSPRL
jgi:hypothetical protein